MQPVVTALRIWPWTVIDAMPYAFKGPNLTSIDLDTGAAVRLFNPRLDDWSEHFLFEAGEVLGLTPTGRATVRLLNINAPRRVQLRQEWLCAEDALEEPDPVGD